MIYFGDYVGTPRITFGDDGATFLRVCPKCGRFVQADDLVWIDAFGRVREPNAICAKHGRVAMPFEGFVP